MRIGMLMSAAIVATTLLAVAEYVNSAEVEKETEKRPNILLIVADDLGYSDIGTFGGEISTPNLDKLSIEGAQLTSFYASPFCSPTRSMLMSGADNHRVGLGDMAELMTNEQRGKPGYEGYLGAQVAAVPEVLRAAGYRTVMAGKWHLGNEEQQSPAARGFDKSYAMTMGGSSHWGNQFGIVALDAEKTPIAMYREDGKAIKLKEPFYSSSAFSSKIIEYLDETSVEGDKPFFAYLAFTAPHWPIHAPEEDIEKYIDRYKTGYDQLRNERLDRMKVLGLLPEDIAPYEGHPHWKKWDQLTEKEKASESKRMAVYAAMVDIMDREIGRVISYLDDAGELENTFIVFMSDNGTDGNSVYDVAQTRDWIHSAMDNSVSNIGKPNSYAEYGPGWAQVGATPFHLYKSFMYEGGIRVPAIVWGPGVGVGSDRKSEVAHVMDIAPTLYELAGTRHPGTEFEGREVVPVQGRSLVNWLSGRAETVYGDSDVLGWELGGRKGLRRGDWKIVYANQPWGSGEWELYNVIDDPTEAKNVAEENPELMKDMLASWNDYVRDNGVLEIEGLADRPGYSNAGLYYEDLEYEANLD